MRLPRLQKIESFCFIFKNEIIEARNPETGKRIWSYQYPAQYRDRYGFQRPLRVPSFE